MAKSAAVAASEVFPGNKYAVRATAAKPLSASRIRVRTPNSGDDRATFVAPIFPLPAFRISSPRNELTRMNPNGIDPRRYPSTIVVTIGTDFVCDFVKTS
jgi:hypothetical protein